MGIYKSLIDTWMWKLGLWPHKSSSGNICFEFSVLFLCSVYARAGEEGLTVGIEKFVVCAYSISSLDELYPRISNVFIYCGDIVVYV